MDYHVKNNSHVDKAFKVRGGHTVVPAGKEAEIVDAKALTEAQIDALDREGVKVKAKGGKAKEEKPKDDDQPKTAAEVLAIAETAHFQTFKAEAAKVLGDGTPSTKDEIIAALTELATKP
jgi:hypothetical protein